MKRIKRLLSLMLALVLLLSKTPTVLAAEVSLPAYRSGTMVADEDTRYITLFRQDPETKLITATVQIHNYTASGKSIVISTVGSVITFSDKVAPYSVAEGGIYTGPLKTGAGVLTGYSKMLTAFDIISPEIMANDNDGRVVSSKVTATESDVYQNIPAGGTVDVIEYYFMPVNGTDELSMDMFGYEYGVYRMFKASTWEALAEVMHVSNKNVSTDIDDFAVKSDAFKIHIQRQEPIVTADNQGRAVEGYDPTTMEWSDGPGGEYASAEPAIGNMAQTVYVRASGDKDYSGADAEYGAYMKYVPSSPVAVEFDPVPDPVKSDPPAIDPVTEGDRTITGEGVPEAEIVVTLPDGTELETEVDENGNWSVEVPEGKELEPGDEVTAVQTEDGKLPSDEVTEEVQQKPDPGQSEEPTIDPITEGDRTITGEGMPEAEITVTLPDGTELETEVDENGNWSVEVPEGKELEPGDEVTAVQTEEGKRPSDEVTEEVQKKPDPGQSERPAINKVTEGDRAVTGKGVPNSEITVTLPDGTVLNTTVDGNGNWSVAVPEGRELHAGEVIRAIQTEEGKRPSDEASTVVQAKPKSEKPTINQVTEGDGVITGKGVPGSEIQVTLPDGTGLRATVDGNGNWSVGVPSGKALVKDDVIRAVQTEQGKGPSDEATTVVQPRPDQSQSEKPTIDPVIEGDDEITGEGVPGAEIVVTLPDGTELETEVDDDGKWSVDVPEGKELVKDDEIKVVQTEEGKRPSDPESAIVAGKLLNTEDHIKYLNGYPDGSVGPDRSITRAEVAAIFYRLLLNQGTVMGGRFGDVPDDKWYAQSVNYLASIGILEGYKDGTFGPDKPITRAEFATVASRFDRLEITGENIFNDVPAAHWAVKYINSAYTKGWINGYPGGTFQPEKSISRAEVVKIVNAMLDREIDAETLAAIANPYNDINNSHWSYANIIEASMVHEYVRDEGNIERWQSW